MLCFNLIGFFNLVKMFCRNLGAIQILKICFVCLQVGKEMLSLKNKDGEGSSSFNLLMELLRGDH